MPDPKTYPPNLPIFQSSNLPREAFQPSTPPPLFDETFLRRLERLSLIARQARAGRCQGERRSTKRGSSVEFADYRNYTPGDDLRRLDWRVYARLDRPFIKLFEEQEDQTVYLLLDASASMDWPDGETDLNKWNFARKLTAALGYIALAAGDRLTIFYLNQTGPQSWGPWRGRSHIHTLLDHLAALTPAGPTDLDAGLRAIAKTRRRPGLLLLVSDLFSPTGYETGLAALTGVGYEIDVLHLLSPDEIEPPLTGDLRLCDVETGQTQDMTIDPAIRHLYRKRFDVWRAAIERYCFSRDINYVTLTTSLDFESVIFGYLRQRGIAR